MGGALGQSHPCCTPVHIPHRAPHPLTCMACSRFLVDVLHNRVDPLTSRGHHTKSPPVHLPDVNAYVNIQCKLSERYSGEYNYI